jgi:molybdate/tungstate transport system substrate-binding protein
MLNKLIVILLSLMVLIGFSCQNEESETKPLENKTLIIFHAGSLSVPMKQIAEAFEKEHPGVNILLEADGSVKSARKISDLKKPCDIMASADYNVIDEILIPEYADWNIKFASNELSIVYHENSHYSDIITAENWYDILLKKDVIFGRSDPNSDPCGYRTILTLRLAENYYGIKGLTDKFMSRNLNYIRPKETDLLALLESNSIDYIFLYKSVAMQHQLKFITLPDSINLKSLALNDYYKTVSIEIRGNSPEETTTITGTAMAYGVTIPKTAPNPKLAMEFLTFMLDKDKGMKIMEANGQPSIVPSFSETYTRIPNELKKYATNQK